MTYEMKYKEALEEAKKLYGKYCIDNVLENLFPELKESEDERIRREIIEFLNYPHPSFVGKRIHKDWIAWLEKQGEKKQGEHLELKAGHWYICHRPYCCRADSLTVKEGEKFQCEKDGVVKGFAIKEPEKYFKEISVPPHSEDEGMLREIKRYIKEQGDKPTGLPNGTVAVSDMIAWLEKQKEPDWVHHCVDLSDCSEEYRKAYCDGWNNCNMQHSQKENEDNSVIKCLINGMRFCYGDNEDATWGTNKFHMKVADIIKWLEKQEKLNEVTEECERTLCEHLKKKYGL